MSASKLGRKFPFKEYADRDMVTYHTDELLRAHGLLIQQIGGNPKTAEYRFVDWQSRRAASAKRVKDYERAEQKA
jgi:hypothetical protein